MRFGFWGALALVVVSVAIPSAMGKTAEPKKKKTSELVFDKNGISQERGPVDLSQVTLTTFEDLDPSILLPKPKPGENLPGLSQLRESLLSGETSETEGDPQATPGATPTAGGSVLAANPDDAPLKLEKPKGEKETLATTDTPLGGGGATAAPTATPAPEPGPASNPTSAAAPAPTGTGPENGTSIARNTGKKPLAAEVDPNADQEAPGHSGLETTDTGGAGGGAGNTEREILPEASYIMPVCVFYEEGIDVNGVLRDAKDLLYDNKLKGQGAGNGPGCDTEIKFFPVKIESVAGQDGRAVQQMASQKCNMLDWAQQVGLDMQYGSAVVLTNSVDVMKSGCGGNLSVEATYCPQWSQVPDQMGTTQLKTENVLGSVSVSAGPISTSIVSTQNQLGKPFSGRDIVASAIGYGRMGLSAGTNYGLGLGNDPVIAAGVVIPPDEDPDPRDAFCEKLHSVSVRAEDFPGGPRKFIRQDNQVTLLGGSVPLTDARPIFGEPNDPPSPGLGANGGESPATSGVTGPSNPVKSISPDRRPLGGTGTGSPTAVASRNQGTSRINTRNSGGDKPGVLTGHPGSQTQGQRESSGGDSSVGGGNQVVRVGDRSRGPASEEYVSTRTPSSDTQISSYETPGFGDPIIPDGEVAEDIGPSFSARETPNRGRPRAE